MNLIQITSNLLFEIRVGTTLILLMLVKMFKILNLKKKSLK